MLATTFFFQGSTLKLGVQVGISISSSLGEVLRKCQTVAIAIYPEGRNFCTALTSAGDS